MSLLPPTLTDSTSKHRHDEAADQLQVEGDFKKLLEHPAMKCESPQAPKLSTTACHPEG